MPVATAAASPNCPTRLSESTTAARFDRLLFRATVRRGSTDSVFARPTQVFERLGDPLTQSKPAMPSNKHDTLDDPTVPDETEVQVERLHIRNDSPGIDIGSAEQLERPRGAAALGERRAFQHHRARIGARHR